MMQLLRMPTTRLFAAIFAAFVLLLLFLTLVTPNASPAALRSKWSASRSPLSDAGNETLGFEHLYIINMPDRTDKKDATTLAAALTGLRIEHVAGVSGDTIPDKALPFHQEARPYSNAQYGVWRSNMNILNDMVKNNVQSALILEDDADWDVRIKAQLVDFARNSRRLLNLTEADQQFSPYGDAWKIVWLGHCASEISNDRIIASHDPTVAVVSKMETTLPEMLKTDFPAHTRLVHIANAPICTYAYGITLQGAKEVLYELSVHELSGLWDNALADFCRRRNAGSECVTASPSYFYTHVAAGGKGKGSDIQQETGPVEKSFTRVIRWSTRLNLWKLIKRESDFFDQYPDE